MYRNSTSRPIFTNCSLKVYRIRVQLNAVVNRTQDISFDLCLFEIVVVREYTWVTGRKQSLRTVITHPHDAASTILIQNASVSEVFRKICPCTRMSRTFKKQISHYIKRGPCKVWVRSISNFELDQSPILIQKIKKRIMTNYTIIHV